MTSYQTGIFAEFIAKLFLMLHGFKILKHRYITGKYTGRAEIDLIAKKKDLIIFVEVKRRNSINQALDAISYKQIKRLRNAADTFLASINWKGNARFDAIIITPFKLNWIKGAL